MPIPIEKILERAASEGFDSELKVAAIVADAQWRARQNIYYIDKDERKGRELDLNAYRIFSHVADKPEITCQINLSIEVKKSREPFIFFTSESEFYERGSGYSLLNWKSGINNNLLPYKDIELKRPTANPARFARSYMSMKDGNTQHIRSGILSAFKGAVHSRDNCNEIYSDHSHDICFFVPLLIVDAPLYECYLDKVTAKMTACEVADLVFIQNYLSDEYGSLTTRVHVVNISAVAAQLNSYASWGESIMATLLRNR